MDNENQTSEANLLKAAAECLEKAVPMDTDEQKTHFRTVEEITSYWNQELDKETLTCHHFRQWWRLQVPKLLTPIPSMDYLYPQSHIDDSLVNEILISPLEKFLCDSEDPEKVFKTLAEKNDPPSVCGKLFKNGDPTYSCRDCGHDPTCVLCVECFKNSEHKHHRYKISCSQGGGYCDCGDPEAWTAHVHCTIHEQGITTSQMDTDDLVNRLPEPIRIRVRHVFTAVLSYIFEMLTTDNMLTVPPDLTYKAPFGDMEHDFGLGSGNDDYCTVIYNDEFHRFDDVIDTIPRAVDCDRNTAIGLTTLVDRNGRCIVKCAGFATCQEVKKTAERTSSRRGGRPLKVVIMHSHIVAHQTFAQSLVSWLLGILDYSSSFRALLGSLLLEVPNQSGGGMGISRSTRLESFVRNDTVLWKSARSAVHHFLITSLLIGNDANRKAFASIYSKNYGQMMKEFITDDHEHAFSVISMSVQLFTNPTLAHYLISEQDVLANIFRTFMSECERKKNDRDKLELHRDETMQAFSRAMYILYDIKYLLTTSPTDEICKTGWTDKLRKGFLHGVSNLLDILAWMQGMDLQVRQTTHHIDHEFEWDTYFKLHISFMSVLTLITKWCCTDKIVYIKTIRMVFKKLFEDSRKTGQDFIEQVIGSRSSQCMDYEVQSKPVALHHPLTRLLAGMGIFMNEFDLTFDSNELDIMEKPSPIQMMEPSLRTTVFVAQIQAGMWRRNGHSLIEQSQAYHDSRWRKEMEDQDITMLQFAGSNMDPNDFLINVINKFSLVPWTREDFNCKEDDSIRQVNTLAEEFFSILIYILSERYVPGVGKVTPEEKVRREIIQLLCIEPMTHSELNKALTEDIVNRETGLEKVVESVAVFKKPKAGSSGKGRYELRSEYFKDYNVFFYRYSRENQSKSEEAQRQRRKAAGEPECTPPPKPPAFAPQFLPLVKIMESDVFLHILNLILDRADDLRSKCFSENQVHKVLHLIGLCLIEEEREGSELKFTKAAGNSFMLEKLQKLVGSQRITSHKDLLTWAISTWQSMMGIKTCENANQNVTEGVSAREESIKDDKEIERKRLAAERRKKVMDQMKNAQKTFMKENKQLYDDTVQKRQRLSTEESMVVLQDESNQEMINAEEDFIQCLGPNRSNPTTIEDNDFTCILCQEEEELKVEGKALVTAAFIQKSTVLSNHRQQNMDVAGSGAASARNLYKFERAMLPLMTSDLHPGIHTSSCGHVMHASCWKTYFEDVQQSERNRSRLRSPQNFNALKQEFLCPLCRSLSNTVIPLIPQLHTLQSIVNSKEKSVIVEEDDTMVVDLEDLEISRGNQVDLSRPIRLDFPDWLSALQIALKYKMELKRDQVKSRTTSESSDTSTGGTGSKILSAGVEAIAGAGIEVENVRANFRGLLLNTIEGASRVLGASGSSSSNKTVAKRMLYSGMKRCHTCPIEQVLQEVTSVGPQAREQISRLFCTESQEVAFSESLYDIMKLYSQSVIRVSKELDPEFEDPESLKEHLFFEVWNTCAYTMHSVVHSELDQGRDSILNSSGMSSREKDCLSAMVRFCAVMATNFGDAKIIRSHCLRLLSVLLEVESNLENPSILDIDALGLLVALTFSLPSLFSKDNAGNFPSGNVQDQHLLKLIYIVHLVQIMLTTDQFSNIMVGDYQYQKENQNDPKIVLEILHDVRDAVGFASDNDGSDGLTGQAVWNDLKEASIPFLRVAAVFYHYLTQVPGPPGLRHFAPNEHEELSKYLGLPTNPYELFREIQKNKMATIWASHPTIHATLGTVASSEVSRTMSFPLKLNSLISLPQDYSELMNNVSSFACPNFSSDESTRVPTMCLICGEVMCSQSYCCQTTISGHPSPVGACTGHTETCGGGIGIFLRVRECKVVLLAGPSKGCFIQSPYVDKYGETDPGLRRGNPLHLCPEKYRKIYKLWLNHGIPQEISHLLESNQYNMINTPWYQL